jgi:hypothetical protein
MDIEEQAVALTRTIGIEKFASRCELLRLKAFAFEQQAQRIPHCGVIVHGEDHWSFLPHSAAFSPGRALLP